MTARLAVLALTILIHFGCTSTGSLIADADLQHKATSTTAYSKPLTAGVLRRLAATNSYLPGMHDTAGGEQKDGFQAVSQLCGAQPQLWSTDFGFSSTANDTIERRGEFLNKARTLYRQNVLITISWHQCNPTIDEPCNFLGGVANTSLEADQWRELLTDGSPLNLRWKRQMDRLAFYLKELQKNDIPVLFRPYHEANIYSFWWGNTDPAYFKALWRQLHDYYVVQHGLINLIWVWSVSYQPQWQARVSDTYPGDDFVDVVGLDIYPPAHGVEPVFSAAWNTLQQLVPGKPIALTEVSRLPSVNELLKHRWAYVVPWGKNMLFRDNSAAEICAIYSKR